MFPVGGKQLIRMTRSSGFLRLALPKRAVLSLRLQSTAAASTTPDANTNARVINGKAATVDRELPDPLEPQKENRRYFLLYAVGVVVSCAIIFNYEKTGSPIINSLMYCLRRSEVAKEALGDNIGYSSAWPWIWGPLNTVQGNIDIQYKVKGDAQGATVHLKATRVSALMPFKVEHLYLEYADGLTSDLLKDESIDFEF